MWYFIRKPWLLWNFGCIWCRIGIQFWYYVLQSHECMPIIHSASFKLIPRVCASMKFSVSQKFKKWSQLLHIIIMVWYKKLRGIMKNQWQVSVRWNYSRFPKWSFAMLLAIPVCPTLRCFRASTRTVQLGSPFSETWSSLRSHAVMTSSRNVSESLRVLTLFCLSPRTIPRW